MHCKRYAIALLLLFIKFISNYKSINYLFYYKNRFLNKLTKFILYFYLKKAFVMQKITFALHLHCFCLIFRNNTKFPKGIDYPTFAHVAFSSVRTLPFSFSSSSTFASSFPTLINNSWINKSFSFTVAAE